MSSSYNYLSGISYTVYVQVFRAFALACFVFTIASASAGTTWDGGGANASWGTANNWNPDGLPLFDGSETIRLGTAFTSGTTLTLDGTRNISSLLINTATAFTTQFTNNVVGSRSEKEPECAME